MNKKVSSESAVKDIRRRTRKKYSSEEKIRIVIDGLRGEDSISSCVVEKVFPPTYIRDSNKAKFIPSKCTFQRVRAG